MLADYLEPAVSGLERGRVAADLAAPAAVPQMELAELQPEWRSYDALLSSGQEVAYAG